MSQPWAPPPDPWSPASQAQSTHIAQIDAGPQHSHNGNAPNAPTPDTRGVVPLLLSTGAAMLAIAPFSLFASAFGGWFMAWVGTTMDCLNGGGAWSCVTTEATWTQALYPLISTVVAFGAARAAWIESRQGRALGFFYLAIGCGALVAAWTLGAP